MAYPLGQSRDLVMLQSLASLWRDWSIGPKDCTLDLGRVSKQKEMAVEQVPVGHRREVVRLAFVVDPLARLLDSPLPSAAECHSLGQGLGHGTILLGFTVHAFWARTKGMGVLERYGSHACIG